MKPEVLDLMSHPGKCGPSAPGGGGAGGRETAPQHPEGLMSSPPLEAQKALARLSERKRGF